MPVAKKNSSSSRSGVKRSASLPRAKAMSTAATFSIDEVYRSSWSIFKEKWSFIYIVLIAMIVLSIPNSIANGLHGSGSGLLRIVTMLWSMIVGLGITYIMARVARLEETALGDFLKPLNSFWSYLWGSIRVGFLVIVGLLLLVIPGIYWAIKYAFVPFLMTADDAFRLSAKMTKGVKWSLVMIMVINILVIILGALALGVGLIVAIPFVYLVQLVVYNMLYAQVAKRA
jgi:hypothetical protein